MYIFLVQFSFCHPKKYTINCKKFCLKQINILFLREQKVKPVIGHLCKKYSIWFSNPEESLFYIIANNLNGFQSVDSSANTLNKRCMALQNQLHLKKYFQKIMLYFTILELNYITKKRKRRMTIELIAAI